MDAKYIALIVIITVWLLLLIIFGFLSWIYQVKHKEEIAKRKQYFADYHILQQDFLTLTPLNLDLKLNDNEAVYAYEERVQVYTHNLKKSKKVGWLYKKYQNPADDQWEENAEQTRTGLLRWTYSLRKANQHSKDAGFMTTMIVTNHRIVFFNSQKKIVITYDLVNEIAPIMVLVAKSFLPGFVLSTKQGVYEIVNHHIKTVIILENLKKVQKG